MKRVDIDQLASSNVFELIGNQWMLVTAGAKDSFNTMTASWGGLGWLWNKPVAILFVRPERYTHEFLDSSDRLSLSFYSESHRTLLQLCGSKSGRDFDKVKEAGLTPCELESGAITFSEASLTLDCRKLFKSDMSKTNFVDMALFERWYNDNPGGGLHSVYIVEIENVYAED